MSGVDLLRADLLPLILAAALGTFAARALPLLAPGADRLPPLARAYLRGIGPAALGGIAATAVLVHESRIALGPEVIAVIVGAAVGRLRGSLFVAMVVAVAAVLLLRATIFA